MNAGDRHKLGQHRISWEAVIPESEVLVLCGEELLERAHEVAHEIEENVRHVLGEGQGERAAGARRN